MGVFPNKPMVKLKKSMDSFSHTGKYHRNQNTYSTMDAVYAFAYALKEWHRRLCGQMKGVCTAMKEANPEDLMLQGYLKNVTFKGMYKYCYIL